MTTRDVFQQIKERLQADPSPISGMNAVYQFHIAAEEPLQYQLVLRNGSANVVENGTETPDCVITLKESYFMKLVAGKLNGPMAVMTGKLKIKGDFGLAMKLQTLLGQYSRSF
jgi:putative sterol carrier protein